MKRGHDIVSRLSVAGFNWKQEQLRVGAWTDDCWEIHRVLIFCKYRLKTLKFYVLHSWLNQTIKSLLQSLRLEWQFCTYNPLCLWIACWLHFLLNKSISVDFLSCSFISLLKFVQSSQLRFLWFSWNLQTLKTLFIFSISQKTAWVDLNNRRWWFKWDKIHLPTEPVI